ncbi:TonB family protein [Aquabacterium sp. G14]|uniref:energy transducer TonB n=1 Tax=Aquabacterium sp. G14 TaxID=3130164 RepID=UPI00309B7D7D
MRVPFLLGGAVLLSHGVLLLAVLRAPAPAPSEVTVADMVTRFEMSLVQSTHSPTTLPATDQTAVTPDHIPAPRPTASVQAPQSVQPSADTSQSVAAQTPAGTLPGPAMAPSHQPAATGEAQPTPHATPTVASAPRTVAITDVQYQRPPTPVYPRRSQRLGETGEVWLKVLISAEGRAAQVLVVRSSGFDALDHAAVEAMKAAIFKPYAENGVAQAVWVQTPIAFHLESAS